MVKVSFVSSFRSALGGAQALEVQARTLRELMRAIVAEHPGMQKYVDEGIALAINGEIYRDNWDIEIPAGAEVFLMPRIQGG
jgi:molybdopterin converting factor small subunit